MIRVVNQVPGPSAVLGARLAPVPVHVSVPGDSSREGPYSLDTRGIDDAERDAVVVYRPGKREARRAREIRVDQRSAEAAAVLLEVDGIGVGGRVPPDTR